MLGHTAALTSDHAPGTGAGNASDRDGGYLSRATSYADLGIAIHDGTPRAGATQRHVTRETRRQNVGDELMQGSVAAGMTSDECQW